MSKKIKFISLILFVFHSAFFSPLIVFANANDSLQISVTVFSQTYYGNYQGNVVKGVPSGEGSFTCTDPGSEFTLSGTWNNGLLKGKATINHIDGSFLNVSFKNGLISGKVTEYSVNGSYKTYYCTEGRPYKYISFYDNTDALIDFDCFYQMRPISSLKKSCIGPDYGILLNSSYSVTPYKISGTVLETYDDSSSTYILLEDDNRHIYVLTYKNINTNKYNQAIVPNLVAGDNIIAYGFLQKNDSLSSIRSFYKSVPINRWSDFYTDGQTGISISATEDLLYNTSTVPFVRIFAAEAEGETPCNRLNPSYSYDDIVRNPYLYSDLKCSLAGRVIQAQINYEKQAVSMKILTETDKDEYYIYYTFSEGDPLPAIGDDISVNGTYAGNYKTLLEETNVSEESKSSRLYVIYPRINTKSITIL